MAGNGIAPDRLVLGTWYLVLATWYLVLGTCYLLLATCYLLLATCYLLLAAFLFDRGPGGKHGGGLVARARSTEVRRRPVSGLRMPASRFEVPFHNIFSGGRKGRTQTDRGSSEGTAAIVVMREGWPRRQRGCSPATVVPTSVMTSRGAQGTMRSARGTARRSSVVR